MNWGRVSACLALLTTCTPGCGGSEGHGEGEAHGEGHGEHEAPGEHHEGHGEHEEHGGHNDAHAHEAPHGTPGPADVGSDTKHPALPQGAIATVGEAKISQAAFDAIYELKVRKFADRGGEISEKAAARYRKSISDRLIYQEALRQETQAVGVEYDEAAVDRVLGERKRGFVDWEKQLRVRGESDASLREIAIAEQREVALLTKHGRLQVSRIELEEEFDKVRGNWSSDRPWARASQILIPVENGPGGVGIGLPDQDALQEATRIHALVVAPGADFASLARTHSSGPFLAKGGDMGIFTEERQDPKISKRVFAMEQGSVSEPFRTKAGYHIVKVTGRWPAGQLPFDAVEDLIQDRLRQQKLLLGRRALKEELSFKYEVRNLFPSVHWSGGETDAGQTKPNTHANAGHHPPEAEGHAPDDHQGHH